LSHLLAEVILRRLLEGALPRMRAASPAVPVQIVAAIVRGVCGTSTPDGVDTDDDGVPDACDRCPNADDRLDADGDGIPDG